MDGTTDQDPILIDPDGDLELVVGGESTSSAPATLQPTKSSPNQEKRARLQALNIRRTFRVSSKILMLSSSVFKVMFSPSSPFREARELYERDTRGVSNPVTVFLQDDHPNAMDAMLKILHNQGHKLDKVTDVYTLYRLAIVCDKYDVMALVAPWVSVWLNDYPLEAHLCLPGPNSVGRIKRQCTQESLLHWTNIIWAFQLKNRFEATMVELICRAEVLVSCSGNDSTLLSQHKRAALNDVNPMGIKQIRRLILKERYSNKPIFIDEWLQLLPKDLVEFINTTRSKMHEALEQCISKELSTQPVFNDRRWWTPIRWSAESMSKDAGAFYKTLSSYYKPHRFHWYTPATSVLRYCVKHEKPLKEELGRRGLLRFQFEDFMPKEKIFKFHWLQ